MPGVRVAIYGAGGSGREVAWLVTSIQGYEVVCFIDDEHESHGKLLNGFPVMGLEQAVSEYPDAAVVGAVGSPSSRERLMSKTEAAGMHSATIVHPRTEMSQWVDVGEGTVICAGTIVTTNVRLGRHVQINFDCTIAHDVIMGDFTTLAPGVHVSGWVHFGQRVYVGTGAVILNGSKQAPLTIGDDAIVGAGACVTRSVEAATTVVGVPATPLAR